MATQRDPNRTRQRLLEAAFQEIYKVGFQAASLTTILSNAGVTKGALYHHFKNKKALGYAVVDEVVRRYVLDVWLYPFQEAEDPLSVLQGTLRKKDLGPFNFRLGCPLNNLAQEMSPLDNGFRKRLEKLFCDGREGIAEALRQGQEKGYVRADIDPLQVADFFLAALEGSLSMAKSAQDESRFMQLKEGLARYLETLRPKARLRKSTS